MDGILLVDKPAGWTSHDVVAKVRNILFNLEKQKVLEHSGLDAAQGGQEERASRRDTTMSERQTPADTALRQKPAGMPGSAGQQGKAIQNVKVGHAGTLDPFATGLLVLLVGNYTKKAGEFLKLDKTYEAELWLGATSSTGDPEGEITPKSAQVPTDTQIQDALNKFIGEITQIPPAYSAIKVDGQRAYKLARAGKQVKIEPRQVQIYSIKNIRYNYPKLNFLTEVSSGTYIRSLAEDIGQELDTGAYLSSLRRTQIGEFEIKNAFKLGGSEPLVVKTV